METLPEKNHILVNLLIVHIVINNLINAVLSLIVFIQFIFLVDWVVVHLHDLLPLPLPLADDADAGHRCDEHKHGEDPGRKKDRSQHWNCS